MNNYDAIMKMNREQLEAFLDCVYCTGLNNGMFYQRQPEGTAEEILDENPFDMKGLEEEAEPATLCEARDEDDEDMLEAYAQSILLNAGINLDNEQTTEEQPEGKLRVVMRNGKSKNEDD